MDVVFAVLPFADVGRPAIGVSLLKAEVEQLGFSASIQYLNFDLAESIGHELYQQLSDSLPSASLVGEWFFADVVFGDQLPHEGQFVDRILSRCAPPAVVADVVRARAGRRAFVEECVRRIRAARPRVVGFTTTFHQTCACLAVAQRLKQEPDPPIVVFGGANCEGEMGVQLVQSFPWIDYVCTQEGDLVFPELLRRLLGRGDPRTVPGIVGRGAIGQIGAPLLVRELDELPIPDYADYVARVERSTLGAKLQPALQVETSRGCWWGAKHHCTFCGLNGATMSFRSKSPERVFEELSFLRQTYGLRRIDSVDNILDLRYVQTLFPRLIESELDLELFYEVKANLRYDQLATLRAGGVRAIQPGIESFSNEVLRLMGKGCTGAQNVQLLRWCQELDVTVAWNILAGFPTEAPAEYARQAELVPLLTHLQPPASCSPIRLDRFSPLFVKAEEFGLRRVRPTSAYYYVFPLGRRELARLAYFFDFDYPDGRDPNSYIVDLRREVEAWWASRLLEPERQPRLDAVCDRRAEVVEVVDTRACAVRPRHRLDGLAARVFLTCDVAHSLTGIGRQVPGASLGDIGGALEQLRAAKLVAEIEGQYVSLAVFRNRPPRSAAEEGGVPARVPEAAVA
ncbi:MAG TPA: RiPP maturation radical SAM C-methyltransferase [Chloroflexota bacterium]|nr:RiPP maturation radical SAM C-methyltransferase [Chloroflexota bacterium]